MNTYEKKYKEALELAKDYFKANQRLGELEENDMLSDIFPELKESEDERIRKELLEFLDELSKLGKNTNFDRWSKSDCADWIIWLEKQGETYTKKDIDNAYLEGMAFAKDELEKQNKQILANSAKTCKDEQQPTDNNMKEALRTEYEKGRADAIAEIQNPAWSKEDEGICRAIINDISNDKSLCKYEISKGVCDMQINWLKSLKDRVQPKQEWSEDDEERLQSCLNILQAKGIMGVTETINTKWLKSLKDRYTWKPSDEQMKALHDLNLTGNISYAGQGQVLIELYNNLKKLTE